MTTKKKPVEEERIYIIIPKIVDVPLRRGRKTLNHHVRMDSRWGAQAVHAALLMMDWEDQNIFRAFNKPTIILSVRNSKELEKVRCELTEQAQALDHQGLDTFMVHEFQDVQPDYWGTPAPVTTAICLSPTRRSVVESTIGHLEKYED